MVYVSRIQDITRNIKKQDEDIVKILNDTRDVQRNINPLMVCYFIHVENAIHRHLLLSIAYNSFMYVCKETGDVEESLCRD